MQANSNKAYFMVRSLYPWEINLTPATHPAGHFGRAACVDSQGAADGGGAAGPRVMGEGAQAWGDRCVAIHEAGHVVTARYFGLTVTFATMGLVVIPQRPYRAADDDNSIENLIVNASGDAATTAFLNWTGGDIGDNENSVKQLRGLGAGFFERRRLMRDARQAALVRVWSLKGEIFAVAAALRGCCTLSQAQIDALIRATA